VALVYNAERINTLAGRHWQRFARQNYFDGNGVFAGVLLGAPLLLIMFVILVRHSGVSSRLYTVMLLLLQAHSPRIDLVACCRECI
jgi:Transmembrane protein 18